MSAVRFSLSNTEARALHWLIRHLSFEDVLQSTPPHLGKDVRTDRTYEILHAAGALQIAIEKAGQFGDGWMYAGTRP